MLKKLNRYFFEGDEDTEFSTSDKVFGMLLGITVFGALALCVAVGIMNL
ncbi:hypothetical protein [Listeria fleischmannii]|nr:hypothetical protein [Listeria fleischmannii]